MEGGFWKSLGLRWLGLGATAVVKAWMSTLRYRVAYEDPTTDPLWPEYREPRIYLLWHEYILAPLYLRRRSRMSLLVSRHRDAELLSQGAALMGYRLVRGSTGRGGVRAIKELLREGRAFHLVITPDGPRGPRRRMASGAIYLASRLEMPIVLLGFGYDRCWRAPTWDRFAIPLPFARACCIVSRRIVVPSKLSRETLPGLCAELEQQLDEITQKAEHWALTPYKQPTGYSTVMGEKPRRGLHPIVTPLPSKLLGAGSVIGNRKLRAA